MRKLLIIFVLHCSLFSSCTMSVNVIETSGDAENIIEEDQKTDADVSPDVSIPAAVL